jgi:hypothetical protein
VHTTHSKNNLHQVHTSQIKLKPNKNKKSLGAGKPNSLYRKNQIAFTEKTNSLYRKNQIAFTEKTK